MTTVLFKQWLQVLDMDMKKKKRKILLFIDNSTAHNDPPSLKNVKLEYVPPNTTSKLQPLYQGIIKVPKTFYRTKIVRKLLECIDEGRDVHTITDVYSAMVMANKAWRNGSAETIGNCFKKAGFVKEVHDEEDEDEKEEDSVPFGVSSEQWNRLAGHMDLIGTYFNDFAHFDDNISAYGNLSDEGIVAMNRAAEAHEGDDDDMNDVASE